MGTLIGSQFLNLKATQFNGVDEYAYRADPTWKSDTQGAFSFWVYLPAVLGANGYIPLIGYGTTSGANDSGLMISARRLTTTGSGTYLSMFVRATNGGTNYGVSATTTALSAGTWYHVVAQSNGSARSVYINGVAQTMTVWFTANSGTWFGGISGTNHRVAVASNYNAGAPSAYGSSRIDEIDYFNRALTGSEASWLYNGGTPRNPHRYDWAGAWHTRWRMGDSRDDATTIYDEIGSDHLTLVNMDASNYVTP